MQSNSTMIHRLQSAINEKFNQRILYNKTQWYSIDQDRPVTMYKISKAEWDAERGKTVNVELFRSHSQIQIVLFLRDMWYELNGWEVPNDNEEWNKIKMNYKVGD